MSVKVVTDSTADISPEVAQALGITVVPVYIRFGDEIYRDGVDISNDGFYHKLVNSFVHPTTSEPTPEDFAGVYSDCTDESDSIISIHISAKISDTYKSALQGKKMMKGECQIEVIDSHLTSVGLGLVVMTAARLAQAGKNLVSIFEETRKTIGQVRMLGMFDTMKYLVLGGRVNKATASIAKAFNIKPLLTFQNGEIVRTGLARTYSNGIDRLCEFVESCPTIVDLAIAHSMVPEQAEQLKTRLGSIFPAEKAYVTQLGAAIGVHGGPGVLLVAFREGK